jgi:methylenetetrahydrofolate dehydrogenase (NADP+) / methenyltetrahydrofolate cyclohydrolase
VSARILDGAARAREIRAEVAAGVGELTSRGLRAPGLAAVLVGDDPASRVYVGSKERSALQAGFVSRTIRLPATISRDELSRVIEQLNDDGEIDGIIVQLPLPGDLSADAATAVLDPAKDVDGIHPENVGRLWLDLPGPAPATPSGIVELLRREGIAMAGKRAVVVGRSRLVGKPLAALLLREQCTVTLCHSRTTDLAAACREAEILVAAAGQPTLIGPDHVAPGAVVIDVGIHRATDAELMERLYPGNEARREAISTRGYTLIGDVDFTAVSERAAAITPVPGGVGPLTVAMLLVNTLGSARRRQGAP